MKLIVERVSGKEEYTFKSISNSSIYTVLENGSIDIKNNYHVVFENQNKMYTEILLREYIGELTIATLLGFLDEEIQLVAGDDYIRGYVE